MKKISLFVLLTLCYVAATAQSNFQFGVRAGGLNTYILNPRVLGGTGDTTYRASFGFSGGLTASWYLNSRTYYSHNLKGLHFEALFNMYNQGYKATAGSTKIQPFTASWRLSYIDLGLYFRTLPSSDNGVYFQIGPQLGLLMGSNFQQDAIRAADGTKLTDAISNTSTQGLAGTNLGAVMEIGKLFNNRRVEWSAIYVGLRFSYGFTDITKSSRDLLENNNLPYFANRVASVGLMLGWHYKGRNYYN